MAPKNSAAPQSRFLRAFRSGLLVLLAFLWLPFVLAANPGWLTILFLVTPAALVCFVPLLMVVVNRRLRTQLHTAPYKQLQIAFYISWFLAGFCLTNFGDTEESVRSLFTRAFSTVGGHETLVVVSQILFLASAGIAALTMAVLLALAIKGRPKSALTTH